jgi:hypothetical protein
LKSNQILKGLNIIRGINLMSINLIKERIENMSKYHQVEVLRLFNNYPSVKTNENNNGTFINLTEQSQDIIQTLEKYINYVDEQQKNLKKIETEKDLIEQNFFSNNNIH